MKLSPPASSSDLEAAREIARRLHQRRRRADQAEEAGPDDRRNQAGDLLIVKRHYETCLHVSGRVRRSRGSGRGDRKGQKPDGNPVERHRANVAPVGASGFQGRGGIGVLRERYSRRV